MKFRSFAEAREFCSTLGLKSGTEWTQYIKSGKKPADIPPDPRLKYKNEWQGMGDWLGMGLLHHRTGNLDHLQKQNNLFTPLSWKMQGSGKNTVSLSTNHQTYLTALLRHMKKNDKDGMTGLGTEEDEWSVRRVKELLKALIKTGIIYQWNEAVLYSFLLRKGLFSLQLGHNRHKQFFERLIEASRTKEGQKVIEEMKFIFSS